jgi:hypothetical protein
MPESLDAERDALRAGLDNPDPSPQPNASQSSSATSSESSEKPEAAKPESKQLESNQDNTQPKPEIKPEVEKKETDYSKAKRGRERLEDIRLKAEADKAEARAEREATERARAEFRRELQQSRNGGGEQDASRFSAQELSRAADWYESEADKAYDEGDPEKAKSCRANARAIKRTAGQAAQREQQSQYQQSMRGFAESYKATAERVIAENPDLGNPETESFKAMDALLQSEPILTMIPDGFKKGFEILQMRQVAGDIVALSPEQKKAYNEAGKAAGLLTKVTELKAEVDRLTNLTSLEKGSPAPLGKSDNVSSLPLERQRAILRARAEAS